MRVEWFGQSAFRLDAAGKTVAIDPFGDMSALSGARGIQWDYPAIAGVEPDLLRSTAGRLQSPLGDVLAIASEHDDSAGTERGPNTIFVFELDGVRVCHMGDFGQGELREQQAAAIGEIDLLFVPVGGGPTAGAEQAAAIVKRLSPRWVVPMHYRTPRIGFLETAEEFLAGAQNVARLDAAAFETGELEQVVGPLVVVPAAP
jgi:L-ascorbate metabolism protein UlaG (beta-lactamase superfamily)